MLKPFPVAYGLRAGLAAVGLLALVAGCPGPAKQDNLAASDPEPLVSCVAFTPGGATAVGRADGKVILQKGERQRILEGRADGVCVWSVAFAPDGQTLASGARDGSVILWDVATGEERVRFVTQPAWVRQVAFSPDGSSLAVATPAGISLGDVKTLQEQETFRPEKQVWSFAFAPDGRRLAVVVEGEVILWEPATGERRTLPGVSPAAAYALAFAPDGETLALATEPGPVRLVDAKTGQTRREFGGTEGTYAVAISDDGKTLAAADGDGVITLWEVQNGRMMVKFPPEWNRMRALAFAPGGRMLASVGWPGALNYWPVPGRD